MNKNESQAKLEEGKYYPFKITGSVILPDGSECYILSDINNVKHLLYKEHYKNYGLKLNQQIFCRIDKINCTGKIFIEPEHPYYKLGKSFEFLFDSYNSIPNSIGDFEQVIVFKDVYNHPVLLPADEIDHELNPGEKLKATVEKLKKGKVYISLSTSYNDFTGMKAGETYSFVYSHQVTMGGRYEYFVLKNDDGKEFRIRKKFYNKYGYKEGDKLECFLVENDHQVYLEPIHPYYEIGNVYTFSIIGETSVHEYPDKDKPAFLLENLYGKNIVIKKEEVDKQRINQNEIRCIVNAIVKSQISVSCK